MYRLQYILLILLLVACTNVKEPGVVKEYQTIVDGNDKSGQTTLQKEDVNKTITRKEIINTIKIGLSQKV